MSDLLPRIRITFETVTPESAEEGDFAETGWVDEEGVVMEDNVVDDAVEFLRSAGCLEPSSSPFQPGAWYTQADADVNYTTGEHYRESFHLVNFTAEQEQAIYAALHSLRGVA